MSAKHTLIDLTRKVYGKLTVIERDTQRQSRGTYWICRCECGSEKSVLGSDLKTGKTKSCGCIRKQTAKSNTFKNMIGIKSFDLTVVEYYGSVNGRAHWICQCTCGETSIVCGKDIRSGNTKSCGCRRERLLREFKKNPQKFNYAYDPYNKNGRGTKEYYDWRREVYARDNHTCRKCTGKGELHAHHIENYSSNDSRKLDVDNGITFCSECHRDFHMQYGNKNNNQRQVDEFIGGEK